MSNTLFIFINSNEIPAYKALQESIKKLGFELQLDPEYAPFDDHGYSPCILNNDIRSGFEIAYELAENITENNPDLLKISGINNYCIQLSWTSNIKDYASAMIVGSALAADYHAVISFEGEKPESLKRLIAHTHAIIKEAELNEEKEKITRTKCENTQHSNDINQLFKHELAALKNEHIETIHLDNLLFLAISNNTSLTCKTYSCTTRTGDLIDISNYSGLRAEQIELMSRWSEEPTPEESTQAQEAQWDVIENALDAAEREDEEEIKKFRSELESWPEKPVILKVQWHQSGTLRIYFKDLGSACINMYALNSSLFGIELRSDNYIFNLSGDKLDLIQ